MTYAIAYKKDKRTRSKKENIAPEEKRLMRTKR